MYALVDCNSFYASCERVFRPDLANRPVAVLSNNDGCVIAATSEAKRLGLVMGVPYFKAREICRRHNVAVFSSNYTLYGDLSRRVMVTLRQFSKEVEVYSIDEAFLRLEEMGKEQAQAFGDYLAGIVKQWIGLPVCVGIGPTKTLAKAANRIAKNRGRHSCKLEDAAEIDTVLADFPVQELWGVSSRLTKRLNRLGIATALELKRMPPLHARKLFSVTLERTVRELNGEPCIPMEVNPPAKQQIHVSRSFGKLVTDLGELEQAIATHAARVGEKLREQMSVAGSVYVWIATNPFREQDSQYQNAIALPLMPATSCTPDLIAVAVAGLRAIYKEGYKFKRAGVMALDLADAAKSMAQGSLFFSRASTEKSNALMKALDAVNNRYGAGTMLYARQGLGGEDWRMQRRLMSPHYTTQWDHLPRVS